MDTTVSLSQGVLLVIDDTPENIKFLMSFLIRANLIFVINMISKIILRNKIIFEEKDSPDTEYTISGRSCNNHSINSFLDI